MELKRSRKSRIYQHKCLATGNSQRKTREEICPDCGQRGELWGYNLSVIERMARTSRVQGFSCVGPQVTFLPVMARGCKNCHGRGIFPVGELDFECPECDGLGEILIRSEQEMAKIRRWAKQRHARYVWENQHPEAVKRPVRNPVPKNPAFSRSPLAFIKELMATFAYREKYGKRNEQIGELILRCDDHGWDVFMEMIETWNDSGGGLDVSQEAVLLNRSPRKNAVTLLSIYPPSDQQPQRILVHRSKIRQIAGPETERLLWERIAGLNLSNQEWITIREEYTQEEAGNWILDLAKFGISPTFKEG